MVQILPKDDWSLQNSLSTLEKLSAKMKQDLCVIIFDVREQEPEVLEVRIDVFQNQSRISLQDDTMQAIREILGTLEVKSNPELMECIHQSQIDKKKGNFRKFEDVARECGLNV